MPKGQADKTPAPTLTDIESHLCWQAIEMLEELADTGLFGLTKEAVAARFIENALVEKLDHYGLKVKRTRKR